MKDLVFLKNEQALTTSLKVAEYFDKRHDRVLRTISASIQALPKNGDSDKAFIKSSYMDESGKSNPMYLLNRDGFMFVVMGFTGKKAAELKWNYIQELTGYKELSTVIHELYVFAVENGCKVSEKVFYMNFAKLINKTLGINPKSRDAVSWWKLFEIDKLQFMAKTIIAGLLAKGADYHQPYKDCKETFDAYARLSFINQRLLEA